MFHVKRGSSATEKRVDIFLVNFFQSHLTWVCAYLIIIIIIKMGQVKNSTGRCGFVDSLTELTTARLQYSALDR